MSQERLRFRVPNVKFRVLIVGRANAGKTSILQRVCETTESPKIYRVRGGTREEIHLDPTAERGNHHIKDELVFTNHDGYVFHDSCGFEAGHEDELRIVQDFVREKATARRLQDRLHAIWYCIPMENNRPSLDMKFIGDICPDKNVPVIAVFTKYDQFKRDIRIKLEGNPGSSVSQKEVADTAEKIFQDEYWNVIKGGLTRHVRLQKMHKVGEPCDILITETENALSNEVVTLMLLAIQRGNLERSVKSSLRRVRLDGDQISIVKSCTKWFPHTWYLKKGDERDLLDDLDDLDLELEELLLLLDDNQHNHLADTLSSMIGKIDSDTFNDGHTSQYTLLVSILLLEYATVLFVTTDATLNTALNEAYSRLNSSYDTFKAELSSLVSQDPSTDDYLAFILNHRLATS